MATIIDIFRQYGIEYDSRLDWVSCRCPFCGGTKLKLGFFLPNPYWTCFQCGFHRGEDALVGLLGVGVDQARELWRSLSSGPGRGLGAPRDRRTQAKIRVRGYRRPDGTADRLTAAHRRYLKGRRFDPDLIEREWGVVSTGPASELDGVGYRNRILIPIRWGGTEVSFQARDTSGRSDRKYMACPEPRELEHHKHVLYGRQEAWADRLGIAVEGVTDAWRLGLLAFAVFGVGYTVEQVGQMRRHFDRVAVVFDGEREAQRRARRLAERLTGLGVSTTVISPGDGDPGGMGDDDARCLVADVRRWGKIG